MTHHAPLRRHWHLGLALAAVMVALPVSASVQGAGVSMEILLDGVPLTQYAARGTHYIEAVEGRDYAIRLSNNSARRVAVALSVDGLNTIDAKTTTAGEASKWVLAPWQTVVIDGWQVSSSHARRFFFTTEERSYGAWLGTTTNLGVIEAAVFRERQPFLDRFLKGESSRAPAGEAPADGRHRSESSRKAPIPNPSPEAAAPGARSSDAQSKRAELSDDLAATGIGSRVDNPVRRVSLDLEGHPAAHLRVRYEYRPQLVSLGVLPRIDPSLERRERADGFTDFDFAPDPYDRGR